jgi:hypothetical protein
MFCAFSPKPQVLSAKAAQPYRLAFGLSQLEKENKKEFVITRNRLC